MEIQIHMLGVTHNFDDNDGDNKIKSSVLRLRTCRASSEETFSKWLVTLPFNCNDLLYAMFRFHIAS